MRQIFCQNSGFGDTIWVEPIVRYFIENGEEVALFVSHPCIFDNYPASFFLNDFSKIFPLKEDAIFLRMEFLAKMHYLQAFMQQAKIEIPLTLPRLYLSEKERAKKIPERYAVLHLDPYFSLETLPRNAYGISWKDVVVFLQEKGFKVIQITGRKGPLVADVMPTENMRDVMSLIYNASLFIGLDSGPSHIASALGIPSVIFFGSVNPYFRHINQEKKVFVQAPCPMAHCYHEPIVLGGRVGTSCQRVPEGDAPPCAIHKTETVLAAIETLGIGCRI